MHPQIILATLNAKFIHASLGLRYLLANMQRYGGDDLYQHTVLHRQRRRRRGGGLQRTAKSALHVRVVYLKRQTKPQQADQRGGKSRNVSAWRWDLRVTAAS